MRSGLVALSTFLNALVCAAVCTITCKTVASLHCTDLSRQHSCIATRMHSGLVVLSTFLNALVFAAVCTLVTATLDNAFACSWYADLAFQQL